MKRSHCVVAPAVTAIVVAIASSAPAQVLDGSINGDPYALLSVPHFIYLFRWDQNLGYEFTQLRAFDLRLQVGFNLFFLATDNPENVPLQFTHSTKN